MLKLLIKPLDEEAVIKSAAKTKAVVTAEEHFIYGGMGESVAGVLARNNPVPIEFVGVNDTFGESGKPADLLVKYHLDVDDIVKAAKKAIARK